jgi:hypothetical protein
MRTSTGTRFELPHRGHLARLQRAQEPHLEVGRDLADLVEKQRPAVRQLEVPAPRLDRAREGPAHVTEQLALDQVLGDGRAVDRHEGARRTARADAVQRLRQHFLADSAFTQEEHGGLRLRGAAHHVTHRVEAGRDADHLQVVVQVLEQPAGARLCGRGRGQCGHAQAEVVGAQAGEVRARHLLSRLRPRLRQGGRR